MIYFKTIFLLILWTSVNISLLFGKKSIKDVPFIQEYHKAYPVSEKSEENFIRTIAVDKMNQVWAGSNDGLFFLNKKNSSWEQALKGENQGPVFDLETDESGNLWIAGWNGIYQAVRKKINKISTIKNPISVIHSQNGRIIAMGPHGIWRSENNWDREQIKTSRKLRAVLSDPVGNIWLATGTGLYFLNNNEIQLFQTEEYLITPDIYGIDFGPDSSIWVAGLGGISVLKNGINLKKITPENGLLTVNVRCIKRAPDSTMWIGTNIGITRFENKNWSVRHSRRWLVNDQVNDIAFDAEGTAWIATAAGVSAIYKKKMTLQQKATYFQKVLESRHIRVPYLVEKCMLNVPGDTSSWMPRDDDNDGQYTGMYLVMESYRYAITKDPEAKSNAKQAFEALKFLQTVTETDGFVARTVIPTNWKQMADPNRTYSAQERAKILVENPRDKIVEQRWRSSKDGKWLWKGDTSSDEITGHMYGYLFYYDLVADEKEKNQVSEHVCKIVDYIIKGEYNMNDIDGTHTEWAVWNPDKLNNDPDWRTEKNINSLEILSYLKLAYHMSKKEKYQREYEKLLYQHQFRENIRRPKTTNPAWRTHIDEELLALSFPCLLLYESEPKIRSLLRESFEQWYQEAKKDQAPFFNFLYGAFQGSDPDLDNSLSFLRKTPLDLVRWRVDNKQREDIELTHLPEMEMLQTSRLLPVDEISFSRWDNNPWEAVQGDGGYTESDGVFWLLPYWMGRYYGFIQN